MFANANTLREKVKEKTEAEILETKVRIVNGEISHAVSTGQSIAKVNLTKEDLSSSWLKTVIKNLKERDYVVDVVEFDKLSPSDVIVAHLVIDWE